MKYISIILLGLLSWQLVAQNEHQDLITANQIYEKGDYETASKSYLDILNTNINSLKGNYNLGNTLYQREKYEEAIPYFQKAAEETKDKVVRSNAYHNLGNSYLKGEKYKEAVESYMQALRDNPENYDTKNNLALAQRIIRQQQEQKKQQQQQQQQQEQDPNNDNKDQKQEQQQEQENQEEKKDENKQNPEDKDQPINNDPKEENGKPDELSNDEVERLMQIIENEDKKVQEKLMKKARGKHPKPEKDW